MRRPGVADAAEVVAVALVSEWTELLTENQLGKADNRGQRRTDITAEVAKNGDMFDSSVLSTPARVT